MQQAHPCIACLSVLGTRLSKVKSCELIPGRTCTGLRTCQFKQKMQKYADTRHVIYIMHNTVQCRSASNEESAGAYTPNRSRIEKMATNISTKMATKMATVPQFSSLGGKTGLQRADMPNQKTSLTAPTRNKVWTTWLQYPVQRTSSTRPSE